jgi:hypothetical protein
MNARREAWKEAHGPIPKGWVVHSLNGTTEDTREENLAAIPRYPDNLGQVTAPYGARIRELEKQLKLLEAK